MEEHICADSSYQANSKVIRGTKLLPRLKKIEKVEIELLKLCLSQRLAHSSKVSSRNSEVGDSPGASASTYQQIRTDSNRFHFP